MSTESAGAREICTPKEVNGTFHQTQQDCSPYFPSFLEYMGAYEDQVLPLYAEVRSLLIIFNNLGRTDKGILTRTMLWSQALVCFFGIFRFFFQLIFCTASRSSASKHMAVDERKIFRETLSVVTWNGIRNCIKCGHIGDQRYNIPRGCFWARLHNGQRGCETAWNRQRALLSALSSTSSVE